MGVNASSEKKLQKVVFPVKKTSQERVAQKDSIERIRKLP